MTDSKRIEALENEVARLSAAVSDLQADIIFERAETEAKITAAAEAVMRRAVRPQGSAMQGRQV